MALFRFCRLCKHFAVFLLCFCYVKTFALQFRYVFAMSKHLLCSFALYLLCSSAMLKHLLCSFAMYLLCSFAMSKHLLCSFAMSKHVLCRFALQICHVKTFAVETATCFALHLGWWTHSFGKINAKAAKLR